MAISDKTRKLLWGRAANRCSICKMELNFEPTTKDSESVIGEECHIVSGQEKGPRFNPKFGSSEIDEYSNLVLLCRVDHKRVDDQFETFTAELLATIKRNHETWVKTKLESSSEGKSPRIRKIKGGTPEFLVRMFTGKQLLDLTGAAAGTQFGHDEFRSKEDAEEIGSLYQDLRDWADIDPEPSESVRLAFEFSQRIKDLESRGIILFGGIDKQVLEGGVGSPLKWDIAILNAMYSDNPLIQKLDFSEESDGAKNIPNI